MSFAFRARAISCAPARGISARIPLLPRPSAAAPTLPTRRVSPGEADIRAEHQLVLFRFVLAGGDAGGVDDAPEPVAGMGVVVAATSRCKLRVVPTENQLESGPEVRGHKGGLPAHLLGPYAFEEERGYRSPSHRRVLQRFTHPPRGVFHDARSPPLQT